MGIALSSVVDILPSRRLAALPGSGLLVLGHLHLFREQLTSEIELVSQRHYCTRNSLNYNVPRQCQENSMPESEELPRDYWEDCFCHCCIYLCLCL